MIGPLRLGIPAICAMLVALVCAPAIAQQPPAKAAPAATPQDGSKGPLRRLAPGVMKSIDPERKAGETYSRHDVVELLEIAPNFTWAKDVTFRHDVWTLEFKFKPVRMYWVDIPQKNGYMQRKLIWYMVYSVTNSYEVMQPVKQEDDGTHKIEQEAQAIRFIPEFLLEGFRSVDAQPGENKVYPDRVIPLAMDAIGAREDRNRKFFSTAEISRSEIPIGETFWGIATWENVDPFIDRFSVYVHGLTNAYRWRDGQKPANWTATGTTRTLFPKKISRKTLKINFWRPGDELREHEKEIRYGFPGEVDYEWVSR